MNTLSKVTLLLALSVSGMTAVASAATFNFSYLFGSGDEITGTLTGDLNGQFVDNVANVSWSYNGTAFMGTLYGGQYLDGASFPAGPIVSFNALQNNFVFADTDIVSGDLGYSSIFAMFLSPAVDPDPAYYTAVGFHPTAGGAQDLPTIAANWTLTQAPVPDGAATAILLGTGIVALGIARRRRWPAWTSS